MSHTHNMPFGIEFVCEQLGIRPANMSGDSASWYAAECPFCGKKRKLNINIQKDTWHCPACGEGGGMISLYAELKDMDRKEAAKELFMLYGGAEPEIRKQVSVRRDEIVHIPEKHHASSLEVRDAAYRGLISVLKLSEKHREDLRNRGLSDSMIDHLGYRSTPQHDLDAIGKRLVDSGVKTQGVPGFYGKNAEKLVYRKNGILIPVRTMYGLISGFQIRYDNLPEDASEYERSRFRKYAWFYSADKEDGTSVSGCENIHHAGFYEGICFKRICLTEGVLKSDIASFISGFPFVGLTGVANTGRLAEELSALRSIGAKEINICLDMDYLSNPNVEKALFRIRNICMDSGLDTRQIVWPEEFKGIDDFLFYKRSRGII